MEISDTQGLLAVCMLNKHSGNPGAGGQRPCLEKHSPKVVSLACGKGEACRLRTKLTIF